MTLKKKTLAWVLLVLLAAVARGRMVVPKGLADWSATHPGQDILSAQQYAQMILGGKNEY